MRDRMAENSADRWAEWLPIVILCALGWLTAWKIMSYATGQDPRIYLYVAETIRANHYSLDWIVRCAQWFVPGYPLLLAGVLDTLGIFAAYWVNLPIFFLGVWLLARVLRRFATPGETAVAMLIFFWIAVTGHPLNPHFLFLPFRGIIEWTWMFGGLGLMMPAFDPAGSAGFRCRRAVLTALWLMAGALFRETVIFLIVPFGCIWLWQGLRGDRDAWKGLAAMLAPLALAAVMLVGWKWLAGEPVLNQQATRWMYGLKQGGFAKPFPLLLADIVRLIAVELGAFGLLFLAIGTAWAVVRREKVIFTLWITSLLLVLFYAVYKSHVRYTLSAVGLLALVAGWGLAVTLSAATRRLKPAWRNGILGTAALLVIGLTLRAIAGMETWGPRVTRADVNSLRAHPIASAPVVFIEKERRYMVDALLAFTSVAPRDPVSEGIAVLDFPGAIFLSPADDQGAWAVPQGVKSEEWLKHHFDLERLEPDLTFGGARFEVYRLARPSRTNATFAVEAGSAAAGTLWLDFRAGCASERVRATLSSPDGHLLSVELKHPAGLVPIRVPAGAPDDSRRVVTVRIDADAPFTAYLAPVFTPDGQTRWFTMERGRLPSAGLWLGDGFTPRALKHKHGACITSNAVLRLPMPSGTGTNEILCDVWLNLRPHPTATEAVSGHVGRADLPDTWTSWTLPPGTTTRIIQCQQVVAPGDNPLRLLLSATSLRAHCDYLRIEDIGIRIQ